VPDVESKGSGDASPDLFDAFAKGVGISRSDFHPSVDLAQVMRNAGEVLHEYVAGMERLIASRASLKDAFRLDQTIILPRHNNPLKLSQNTLDSVRQLLVGQEGEYLGPRDAVREVSRDLLAHQEAFLDAMATALGEFSNRFDPDEISENASGSSKRKPLFGFLRKLKYWQRYRDLYPTMTATGSGRFPQTFAEEFVKAYEGLIADFKRLGPAEQSGLTPLLAPLQDTDADKSTAAADADDDDGDGDGDMVVTEVLQKLDEDLDEHDIDMAVTAVLEGVDKDDADDKAKG
jgi:type VI secretion system FHA domain protein